MNRIILRGIGFKQSLPAVLPFSGIWVFVVVLAALIIPIGMMMGGIVPQTLHGDAWLFLLTRVPILALVVTALAILTTARVAGPFIPLRRAFEDVTNGDMDRRLRFRQEDKHLHELEKAFNDMMVVLRKRAGSHEEPEG